MPLFPTTSEEEYVAICCDDRILHYLISYLSKLSLEKNLKSVAYAPDNVSKHLYLIWQGKFRSGFTRSFTWFTNSRNKAWTIWVMFFFLSWISTPLTLKVLQVLPMKIIVWKWKSAVVKFTEVKNRGKFTTGKNVYHGVCNCTSFSEE